MTSRLVAALFMGAVLGGCGGGEMERLNLEPAVTEEVLFTGLGASPESLAFGGSGGQATLQLFARYSDGSEQDVTDEATWTSADTAVVTVDGSGTATPVGLGGTSVTAGYDGNEIDIPVTVSEY